MSSFLTLRFISSSMGRSVLKYIETYVGRLSPKTPALRFENSFWALSCLASLDLAAVLFPKPGGFRMLHLLFDAGVGFLVNPRLIARSHQDGGASARGDTSLE